MARIRSIKPDFWTDDKLTECSMSARLLFIATWNFADDYGNMDRSPKQIKARAFPIDGIDCEPLLLELIAQGLLIEYAVDGKKYLHIQGFQKHQVINRPSKPNHPLYEESLNTHGGITEHSLWKGEEGKGEEVNARAKRAPSKTSIPENFAISERVKTWAASKGHDRLEERLEDFVSKAKAKGYTYADWDEGFMGAIRNDWAGLKGKQAPAKGPAYRSAPRGWEKRASDGTWFGVYADEVPAEFREAS